MSSLKPPQHTEKRGNQWWYRRRVPKPLVPIIGRAEFRESLRTERMDEARTLAALRDAQVTLEFERAKAQIKRTQAQLKANQPPAEAAPSPDVPPLTLAQQKFISQAVRVRFLELDDEARITTDDPEMIGDYESVLADYWEESGEALRWGTSDKALQCVVLRYLEDIGVDVQPSDPRWRIVAFRALEGINQATQDIKTRMGGVYVPTPEMPLRPSSNQQVPPVEGFPGQSGQAAVSLGALIDDYIDKFKESEFKRKVKRLLQLFGEMVGRDLDVRQLRQKAVTQFLRDICRLPDRWALRHDRGEPIAKMLEAGAERVMSPTTYEGNYKAPLGTFLSVTRRDHGDDGFPDLTVEGIGYSGNRKIEEDQQRALTEVELKTLFEGEAFASIATDVAQEPLYWFALLALFTGARPRELCQVNPQCDFGQVEGRWYVDLDEQSAAGRGIRKTIKTKEARRIPLHPDLIKLGVVDRIERLRAMGADRMFPEWRVKQGNPYAANGAFFSNLLREAGLYGTTPGGQVTGAYVLRKSFITQCRNQGVVSKEITGHSDGTTTAIQDRHYVFGPEPFARKLTELEKLKFNLMIPKRE